MRALGAVGGEILTHRGREYTVLSGDTARRPYVLSQEIEVDKQMAVADQVNAELGAKFGVSAAWEAVKSEWAALKSKGLELTPEANDSAHATLADHLERIEATVSNQSMTAVDPEVSTRVLLRIARATPRSDAGFVQSAPPCGSGGVQRVTWAVTTGWAYGYSASANTRIWTV